MWLPSTSASVIRMMRWYRSFEMSKLPPCSGFPMPHPSAAITWGGTGTDAQHENGVVLHGVSAGALAHLTGLVALGGDAVLDSEALYDGF